MPLILLILAVALVLGGLAVLAWLLTIAVPALFLDPTNWWAWVAVLAVYIVVTRVASADD